ncbi:DUF3224 domain-containing protein [Kineosporia succinea]|uniref:DUF3224 domain-containing protein n=1 Tax=Kineosporia succinea TaxID=84632 RepID=A0ABT9P6Z7_9ACTN|nr:DUF3224 domain-containing protein [Kineosporia succinea]MDP9828477.1 hypothetical protein [Kineosporia succinea]
MTEIVASFEIKRWDAEVYQEPAEGQTLSQVLVEKEFSGAVTGTSVARLLAARSEGGQGYVASERFEGSVDGRSGALVYQHGGIVGGGVGTSFGNVVPGCGTGELEGATGSVEFRHDENGAAVTFVLTFVGA